MKSGLPNVSIACLVVIAGLAGCDDGTLEASASCSDYCEKLETCDDATDLSGCMQRCAEQKVRSPSYLSARAECAQKLSCNVFQGEVGLMGDDICASDSSCQLNECVEDRQFEQGTSSEQTSYCSRVVSKLNACDRTLQVPALEVHCLDLVGTLSDAYLAEMSSCIEADCAQLVSCLKRAAERYDTDLTMYPGSLAAAQ